jgi:hypothetical protein
MGYRSRGRPVAGSPSLYTRSVCISVLAFDSLSTCVFLLYIALHYVVDTISRS